LPIRQAVEQGSWVRAIEAIAGAGSWSGSDATAKGDGGNGECGWVVPSHLHLPTNPKPAITFCPAVFDLDDDIHLVGVGVGAFEAALFGD
jgi:hypothetical protein